MTVASTSRYLFLLLLSPLAAAAADLTGTIKGLVVDQASQQPLPGANIGILDLELGAITGADGRFVIARVPVGSHRLRASMIGYRAGIRADVIVRSSRITTIDLELAESVVGMDETVVTADYFSAAAEDVVSSVNFSFEEIRRSPGSSGDISRLIQALPSVNMNNDQRNDLIVRGGSPTENLTLIDNVEIPNINHFPTQGASGGPIGLLNVDLISEADFYAGGFSAAYGDRLSSVLAIEMREGNRDEFDGELNLSMAGAGFIVEGPWQQGRGAWVLSARRSYLDVIVGAIGTGAVPIYSDIQGKLSWDLGAAHRLSLLGISGFDRIDIGPDDQDDSDWVNWDTEQHVLGATWKWLWSSRGYANTSLAYTYSDFVVDVRERETRRTLYTNNSQERQIALRANYHYSLQPGRGLAWGLVARRIFSDFDIFAAADTNRLNVEVPDLRVGEDLSTSKVGVYLSYEHTVLQRLTATLGVRFDYFEYNEEVDLAPRLSVNYDLDDKTALEAACGIYYQNLAPSLLAQHPDNRRLENPRADHYVVGLTRRLTPSTQASLEAYYKDYTQLPYDEDDPTVLVLDGFADFGGPTPGRLIPGGAAESRGIEFLVQKKLARELYGTFSYAYGESRYTDGQGVERDRKFDNRNLFSVILGYRPSDIYELSVRWRYAGGRPYTPFDEDLSRELNTGIIQRDRVHEERLPAYHRLDLRFDYRKHYTNYNIVSFFSLLNAYNRANLFSYYWSEEGREVSRINQWSILPVGGFELEF